MKEILISLAGLPIRLAADLPQHDEWLAAVRKRSLGTEMGIQYDHSLQVVLNDTDEYEILDKSGRNHQSISNASRPSDTTRIYDVLEHLIRFNMAKNLINQKSTTAFLDSFEIQIIRERTAFGPDEQIEVRHDSKLELTKMTSSCDERAWIMRGHNDRISPDSPRGLRGA